MTNPLDYVPAKVPDDCVFKISPSGFANFVTRPHNWYRNEVLDENPFQYSTSSVLGTICHYCAEMVASNEEVDKKAIEEYISSKEIHDDYDPDIVRQQMYGMAETLVNDYVLPNMENYLEVETQHIVHLIDNIYAGGTIDVIQGTKEDCMIVDYKTYNSKTTPRAFSQDYKYQLLVYAYILKYNGYTPTRLRLVYVNRNIDGGISEKTGKPLKSYPPQVTVLTEQITQEDMDFIESILELCVDTLHASIAHPELRHVIWHDPRLREE